MSAVVPFRRKQDAHFGTCPECHRTDGYLNVGRDHWFVCDAHATKWYAGSNLFSCWQDESENVWAANRQKLESYRQVGPSSWQWIDGAAS